MKTFFTCRGIRTHDLLCSLVWLVCLRWRDCSASLKCRYWSFAVNSEANARRIALVESCFGSAGQPLCVPGRVLVGEGVLTKMCRKKPKPRQFYLFNDLLVYGNIIINKKKYNKQHIIPLEEVSSFNRSQGLNKVLFCFEVRCCCNFSSFPDKSEILVRFLNNNNPIHDKSSNVKNILR